MKVYRHNPVTGQREVIFNIMKGIYTGKDMGERSISATIEFPSRIDFRIGDYVEMDIANLLRATGVEGGHGLEKFYIYTMPTVKKVARKMSNGKAFQHTVIFYPCQYELATTKMRDVLQEESAGVLYTGFDEFSFYGGANTLMKRIMAVLNERFGDSGVEGEDYWSYRIADSINEDLNTALEKFQFDFSSSSVMDALLKLNDAEGINTKFFINDRMIYVGYKRPYITGVDENNIQRSIPFEFMYGKTSHLPDSTNYGNLFTLTKASGTNSPITRLYVYGSDRNLHRFYCSDRIKSGRYVNKLMLPAFEDDGQTNYIDSPEGIARFGIREGTKAFDNIYPSLRFFYYGNLRDVKYCIKLMGSGLEPDDEGVYDNGTVVSKSSLSANQMERINNEYKAASKKIDEESASPSDFTFTVTINGSDIKLTYAQAGVLLNTGKVTVRKTDDEIHDLYQYPIARIQCYKVVENTDPLRDSDGNIVYDVSGNPVPCGLNKLVESLPPVDLAVFCHATGKVVKCVLYADTQRQVAADGVVPTRKDGTVVPGSCFAVHDADFGCAHTHEGKSYDGLPDSDQRAAWFTDTDTISIYSDETTKTVDKDKEIYKNEVSIHQIHYTDDHWITDVYEFVSYNQQIFNRQGYSAYCWPRINKHYQNSQSDNIEVNSIVDVGPVYIEDTDLNMSEGQQQQTFDIYMRDMGFKINEQTWFGDRVFLFDTCHINFLDGRLAGYSFEMPNESDQETLGGIYVPALKPDGTMNEEFFDMADNPAQARAAFNAGAFWRLVVKRTETEVGRYYVPNTMLNASKGDHVVFLDIFMPDIYVRVAEQRLEREARKYLDANDDGDIQYSCDFDQVRINEQPIFALQMREGAIMRIVDDDLDVATINDEKLVFGDKNGLVTTASMLAEAIIETDIEIVNRDCDYIEENEIGQATYGSVKVGEETKHYLTLKKSIEDASSSFDLNSGVTIRLYSPAKTRRKEGGESEVLEWYVWNYIAYPSEIVRDGTEYRAYIDNLLSIDSHAANIAHESSKVYVGYSVKKTVVEPQEDPSVLPVGAQRYCSANNLTEFRQSKYYEITLDVMEPDLAVADSDGKRKMFALVNGLGDGMTFFVPEYTLTDITPENSDFKRYKIAFELGEDFNENIDYFPSVLYQSDGETEAVHVRLWSIIERDDEHIGQLNYVDLAVDTITIEFNDNTREAGISRQDGQEPERLTKNETDIIYKITATVKEESRASAWVQLAQRMDAAEILQEKTLDFYQNFVNQSRQHYIQLLNLKNTIFDPDGTCKDTFLQVMMLQVGADSMNYQLKYTHYGMNGQTANCGVNRGENEQTDPESGKLYFDSFAIGNAEEVLDHFVYTDHPTNGKGGRWYPQERNVLFPLHKVLQEAKKEESYPTYFIALKASLSDPRDCHWVCEPTQHATNELIDAEEPYFYFNWGILAPGADGHYALTETRGNAYMYGDNLICGKISTLAGNSYFDLTHGNFVLSEGTEENATLSYIGGVLKIAGVNANNIGQVISKLNLLDEIGGENLLFINELEENYEFEWDGDAVFHELTYYYDVDDVRTHTLLPAGKYVFSADGVEYDTRSIRWDMALYLCAFNSNGKKSTMVRIEKGNVRDLLIETEEPCYFSLRVWAYSQEKEQPSDAIAILHNIQLQKGSKSTSFNRYYKHLADAMQGTTEIAGGLTMTSLLLLKNESGAVKAGMSGLTANGENVAMFAGGDYAKALNGAVPVLITKDGIGSKIGCLEVRSATEVQVNSTLGRIRIDTASGGIRIEKNNAEKIVIAPDNIEPYIPEITDNGTQYFTGKELYDSQSETNKIFEFTLDSPKMVYFKYISAFCELVYAMHAGSGNHDACTGTIQFVLGTSHTNTYWASSRIPFSLTATPSGQGETISVDIYNAEVGLNAGTYKMYAVIKLDNNKYYQLYTDSTDKVCGACHMTVSDKVTAKTVIGIDGLISLYSADTYFMVKNGAGGQHIITRGLKTEKSSTEGELYVSSNFIDAFKSLIDGLDEAWADTRFQGPNKDHYADISAKLQAVKNSLSVTKLVASS